MAEVTARIAGTGSSLPDCRLDNFKLYARESIRSNFDVERARESLHRVEGAAELKPEEVFDLWARQVTGIRSRRILDRTQWAT